MSEDTFLLVTPEGWVEVANATNVIGTNGGPSGLQSIIESLSWYEINEWAGIKETPYLPEGFGVVEARMFDTGVQPDPLRLWIKIAAVG